MEGQAKTLPPFAAYLLTRRIPCAALALAMFTAVLWGEFASGIPPLAALLMLAGMVLHLLTPALFALVVFGGGLVYAMQVAGIAAVAVTALTGFSVMSGLLFLLLYALLPALAASRLGRIGGLSRSARLMAIGLFVATMAAITAGAEAQHLTMQSFVEKMVTPGFDLLNASIPVGERKALDALTQFKEMTVWALPGFMAFGFWMFWWLDVLLGRRVALRYGFFRGDHSEMLMLRFDKATGIALVVATLIANLSSGPLQYVAVSTAIMLAGLLALQGVSIVHMWLRARRMQVTLVVMYLMLFIWPAMIIPFIIAGLLDIWFDFRRGIMPANGEE